MVTPSPSVPSYEVFDDFRTNQVVIVWMRWVFILAASYITYLPPMPAPGLQINTGAIGVLTLINAYMHWRIIQERHLGRIPVFIASLVDVTAITAAIFLSTGFRNNFFVFYFPAVAAFSFVFPVRISVAYAIAVTLVYGSLSVLLGLGVDFFKHEEKMLVVRLLTMMALSVLGSYVIDLERTKRRQAVGVVQAEAQENLQLVQQLESTNKQLTGLNQMIQASLNRLYDELQTALEEQQRQLDGLPLQAREQFSTFIERVRRITGRP